MAKPTTVPLWDSNATNMTAPSSALVLDGYADNEIPTASQFNYQLHWLGEWAAWLDTGDLEIASLDVAGNAAVGGVLDVGSNTTVGGILEVIGATILDGTASVLGNASVGGDLDVTGDLTVTGDINHGDRTISQGADGGIAGTGTLSGVFDSPMLGATAHRLSASGVARIPIRGLRVGDRLKLIRVQGDSGNEPTFTLYTQSAGLATSVAYTSSGSLVANEVVDLTVNTPVAVGGNGQTYWVEVTAGVTDLDLWELHVTFDHP